MYEAWSYILLLLLQAGCGGRVRPCGAWGGQGRVWFCACRCAYSRQLFDSLDSIFCTSAACPLSPLWVGCACCKLYWTRLQQSRLRPLWVGYAGDAVQVYTDRFCLVCWTNFVRKGPLPGTSVSLRRYPCQPPRPLVSLLENERSLHLLSQVLGIRWHPLNFEMPTACLQHPARWTPLIFPAPGAPAVYTRECSHFEHWSVPSYFPHSLFES